MITLKKPVVKYGSRLMVVLIQTILLKIAKAGADTFVAGSAIFGAGKDSDPNRYDSVVKSLRESLASV